MQKGSVIEISDLMTLEFMWHHVVLRVTIKQQTCFDVTC